MTKENIHGIITRGVGGLYGVQRADSPGEEVLCHVRGIFRREHLTPTVGDDVVIASADAEDLREAREMARAESRGGKKLGAEVNYVIDQILPRKNVLIRPPVANLRYLFAVIPCAAPAPDLLTADKLTVIAENYGIEPVIVVNKADLDPTRMEEIAAIYGSAGYRVFPVSGKTGAGIGELSRFIGTIAAEHGTESHVSGAFAGVSGAGKSTLMSALFPGLSLKTGAVSHKNARGRHTTRHVELYPVDVGGSVFWIADTPGFSMLDFTRFDFFPYDELAGSFREFSDCLGNCRYTKCTHLREEGCAVLAKMAEGQIAKSRHDSYVRIYEEQRSVPEWKRR